MFAYVRTDGNEPLVEEAPALDTAISPVRARARRRTLTSFDQRRDEEETMAAGTDQTQLECEAA
jgi:hypothetical protein